MFAVYNGLVKANYEVEQWIPISVGDINPAEGNVITEEDTWAKNRYYFVGKVADSDIVNKYINRDVSDYLNSNGRNPIRYVDNR
ncbi:hypothetical protein RI065_06395 [Mycoplasmatota bacterium zrk1]